jgi:hypothetical protein
MTGADPNTDWLNRCLVLDNKGLIKTGPDLSSEDLMEAHWPLGRRPYLLETSLPGVFAAGDVRAGNVKTLGFGCWRRLDRDFVCPPIPEGVVMDALRNSCSPIRRFRRAKSHGFGSRMAGSSATADLYLIYAEECQPAWLAFSRFRLLEIRDLQSVASAISALSRVANLC